MEFLRNVTIGQYAPGNSFVHRLDPRTKILLLTVFIVQTFVLDSWWQLLFPFFFLLAIALVTKISFRYIIRGFKPVVPFILISLIFNCFLVPGKPLFSFLWFQITYEGLAFGTLMSMRLLLIVLATSLFTLTTSPVEITDGLERLLKWLSAVRLPVHEVAMMMSIALRFIPVLMEHLEKIVKAQMSRGADFEAKSFIERAKCFIPVLIPLFVQAFRTADDLAVAMESRCYHGGDGRTRMKVLKAGAGDLLAVAAVGLFCTGLSYGLGQFL